MSNCVGNTMAMPLLLSEILQIGQVSGFMHSDDIGKWGKHLWPLMLDVLGNLRKKGVYSNKYVRHDSEHIHQKSGYSLFA